MFVRFTDEARKGMALARKEAQRLNHDYIGTEHILAGLIQLKTDPAVTILGNQADFLSRPSLKPAVDAAKD